MPTPHVQDHIHLSTVLGDAPEISPNLTWKAHDRSDESIVYVDITTTLDGFVYAHVVGNDTPITRTNYEYDIAIRADNTYDAFHYLNILKTLNGRECYLTDNYHPDNGQDHTDYTIHVLVTIGKIPLFTPGLHLMYVPIVCYSLENP